MKLTTDQEPPSTCATEAAHAERSNQKRPYAELGIEEHQRCCRKNLPTKNSVTEDDSYQADNNDDHIVKSTSCINVRLIPLKIILFAWYAAGACLLPYMTLHMQQLGLNWLETTAVYTILPLIQLFSMPVAGFIADRTGNYKNVLILSLSICAFTTFLLQSAVPARKIRHAPPGPHHDNNFHEDGQDSTQHLLYKVTFWLYLVIRIFHQVTVGLTYSLLDTTTVVLAEKNNSTYGRQRFWAILATGIFSPICGYIIDSYSYRIDEAGEKIPNYDPAFYFFISLTLFTLIMVSMIRVEISSLPTDVWSNVGPLLRSANVWLFLFAVFIMGSCWGFLESYLYVYLSDLKAPSYLLGLTVTVGAFIGLPFLYKADWFVKKVGAHQLLLLALVVYFIRLTGYSLLDNPWWCIPYELMEAFTLHLMWVTTVQIAYQIAPPGMLATMQAVVSGLNFGVGRGFGSLVGGLVIAFHGHRIAFRTIGCMALVAAILYYQNLLTPLPKISDEKSKPNNDEIVGDCPHQDSRRRRQTTKDFDASGIEQTLPARGSDSTVAAPAS